MHIPERPWLNSESLQCLPSAAQNIAPIVQKLFKSTGYVPFQIFITHADGSMFYPLLCCRIKGTKKTGKSSPKSGDSGN